MRKGVCSFVDENGQGEVDWTGNPGRSFFELDFVIRRRLTGEEAKKSASVESLDRQRHDRTGREAAAATF